MPSSAVLSRGRGGKKRKGKNRGTWRQQRSRPRPAEGAEVRRRPSSRGRRSRPERPRQTQARKEAERADLIRRAGSGPSTVCQLPGGLDRRGVEGYAIDHVGKAEQLAPWSRANGPSINHPARCPFRSVVGGGPAVVGQGQADDGTEAGHCLAQLLCTTLKVLPWDCVSSSLLGPGKRRRPLVCSRGWHRAWDCFLVPKDEMERDGRPTGGLEQKKKKNFGGPGYQNWPQPRGVVINRRSSRFLRLKPGGPSTSFAGFVCGPAAVFWEFFGRTMLRLCPGTPIPERPGTIRPERRSPGASSTLPIEA